jgi:hypothetical protein
LVVHRILLNKEHGDVLNTSALLNAPDTASEKRTLPRLAQLKFYGSTLREHDLNHFRSRDDDRGDGNPRAERL